jgi:hypothetical protein
LLISAQEVGFLWAVQEPTLNRFSLRPSTAINKVAKLTMSFNTANNLMEGTTQKGNRLQCGNANLESGLYSKIFRGNCDFLSKFIETITY